MNKYIINKHGRWFLYGGIFGYLFLYIPIIIIIVFSFNTSYTNVHFTGFTLKWYSILIADKTIIAATISSLIIAITASIMSVVLGTLAGIAMNRFSVPVLSTLIIIPIAAPELFLGITFLLFFVLINISLGYTSVILAHITFCISFVAIAVNNKMQNINENILDSARDLGATEIKVFFFIIIPLILPAIIAGALMSFTLSIDDFTITFFTSGAHVTTIPLVIYSMMKTGITPEINALSTIIITFTVLLVIIISKIAPEVLN